MPNRTPAPPTPAPPPAPAPPTLLLAALAGLGEFAATAYLPAVPAIASGFAAPVGLVQATVATGLLTFAVANLLLGPLSDRLGRRAVLLPALTAYVLGCALAAVSPTVAWLYPARMLAAAGAAAGLVVGRAIARDLVQGAALTRLIAAVTLAFSVAPVLAPLIGGILTDHLGWRSIFAVAGLYAAILLPCCWRLPETRPARRTDRSMAAALADYPAMACRRDVAPPLLAGAGLVAALFCFLVGAPVIFLTGLGLSPSLYGGFPLLAMTGFMLGTLLSGRLAGRWSGRATARLGAVIAFGGALLLAAVPVSPVWLLGAMALFNAGLGLTLPALSSDVLQAFPARAGQASALVGFTQVMGGAVGAGLAASWTASPETGVPATMVVLAGLTCLTLVAPWPAKTGERAA